MDDLEQVPFFAVEFAENPEPRCPCVLILDNSASMRGKRLDELNAGLVVLRDELQADSMASKRVELAVVSFGPVKVAADFATPDAFQPPTLEPGLDTPMGAAIEEALALLESRKRQYREAGVAYYRPWVFLITDGSPTDEWRVSAEAVRVAEERKAVSFFAVGVQGANMARLTEISVRQPLRLKQLRFADLFLWLSASLSSVSRSASSDVVPLSNPTAPGGWAAID